MPIATSKFKILMVPLILMMLMGLLQTNDANANHGVSVSVAKGYHCRVYVKSAWTSGEVSENCKNDSMIRADNAAKSEDVDLNCSGYCVGEVYWFCVREGNNTEEKYWNKGGYWPACYHVPLNLPTEPYQY